MEAVTVQLHRTLPVAGETQARIHRTLSLTGIDPAKKTVKAVVKILKAQHGPGIVLEAGLEGPELHVRSIDLETLKNLKGFPEEEQTLIDRILRAVEESGNYTLHEGRLFYGGHNGVERGVNSPEDTK